MFEVGTPSLIHTVTFRCSGSIERRIRQLNMYSVHYKSELEEPPVFLAAADLQGREIGSHNRLVGEVVAEEICVLQEVGAIPNCSLCLLCGDFFDDPEVRKLGGTGNVTAAINAMSKTADQTLAVLGNHDLVDPDRLDSTVEILDGNAIETGCLVIGGVSGIVGRPSRNNRKSASEFLTALQDCLSERPQIVLLHQGPGFGPAMPGWDPINCELRTHSDLLVLFGHCHWPDGPFHVDGRNLMSNVDGRVLVFIPGDL